MRRRCPIARLLAAAFVVMAVAVAGCGLSRVVSADLGDSAFSGSLEIRKDLDRFADSCVVRVSYLSGRGTARVYGISGDVDCRAENVLTSIAAEWSLYRSIRPGGAFGVSLGVLLGLQRVTYDDPGTGETSAGSRVELLDMPAPGVFATIPLGPRSLLRGSYVYGGFLDELLSETLIEFRHSVSEGVVITVGWRQLRMTTTSETIFPTGSSGTQVIRTESRGFTAGIVIEF